MFKRYCHAPDARFVVHIATRCKAWLAIALATLLATNGCTPALQTRTAARTPEAAVRTPNIVVVLVDDMGWRDWSGAGSRFYRTPHLDALAARGVQFDQGYAAAAVCSPSRAALLTGKTPARLRVTDWIPGEGTPKTPSAFAVPDWTMQLPASETTLAEALHPLGYASMWIGKWHLGNTGSLPRDHGFDAQLAAGEIGHPASYFWPYGEQGTSHRVPDLAESGGEEGEYLTDRLTDEVIDWLRQHAAQAPAQPFLLVVSHYTVHTPLQARSDDLAAVAGAVPDGRQDNQTYAAILHALDRGIGRLDAELQRLQLSDNTLVVFTSDNGGLDRPGEWHATSNAPLREGKGYAYEGGLRVPLLIAGPGVRAGRSAQPVSGIDLMPTLLAQAGAKAPAGIDGRNLTALLRDPSQSLPTRSLGWHYPHYWSGDAVTPWSVLRDGDLKAIHYYEDDRWELYDLARDPSEREDLSTTRPDDLARMQRALAQWLAAQHAQPPVPRTQQPRPASPG